MSSKPRVLRVTLGANPNSSSLGIDVTFLIFGGAAAMLISMVAATAVRLLGRGATNPRPAVPGASPSSAPSETH